MRRQQQANEIRTNIVFEFAVVGEGNIRRLHNDVMEMVSHYINDNYNIRVVGINLKKPTANVVYLMNDKVGVDSEGEESEFVREILRPQEFVDYEDSNEESSEDEATENLEEEEIDND